MGEKDINILTFDGLLTAAVCERIVAEMRSVAGGAAIVSGGAKAVDPYVRKVLTAEVSEETADLVVDALVGALPRIEEHFGVRISEIEEPQFLRYGAGDHFVAHQDGNTPLIQDDTLGRKVSVVIFLNEQKDVADVGEHIGYSGGSLVVHGAYPDWQYRRDITSLAGSLVAFRSETTHEVVPVTAGERFTIVSWLRE